MKAIIRLIPVVLICSFLFFSIISCGGGGGGGGVTDAPDTEAPSVPTNPKAEPFSLSKIELTWTASTDNSSGTIFYTVYKDGSFLYQGLTSTMTYISLLSEGVTYCFQVDARDTSGNVSAKSEQVCGTTGSSSDITAPTMPTNLSATPVSSSQVDLSWTGSTDNVGVVGYRIYRSDNGGFIDFEKGTSASDEFLIADTSYCYQVSAVDAAENVSARSNQVCVTTSSSSDTTSPTIPADLSATPVSSSQINLSWTASTDAVGVTGYNVYRGGAFLKKVTSGTFTSDTGLGTDTQYCYQVSAIDAAGNESTKSTETCATTGSSSDVTLPSTPTNLAATADSSSQINLSWTASTDAVGVTGYNVYRGVVFLKKVTGTSTSDTDLSPDTQYCYQVSAIDAAGNESSKSTEKCATTGSSADVEAPTAPVLLSATIVSSSQAELAWSTSSDNVGVLGYKVYSGAELVGNIDDTSATVNGLVSDTQYCFQVSAFDAAMNESDKSNQKCVTTSSGSQTATFDPIHDVSIMFSSTIGSYAEAAYEGDLLVGCNWMYDWDAWSSMYIQNYLCSSSLLQFDLSSLAGKTIDSASLKLEVGFAGTGFNYSSLLVRAMYDAWSPDTVSWNYVEGTQYYKGSSMFFDPPDYAGQIYDIDLTAYVQNWTSGNWNNYGILFRINDYLFPYATSFDTFSFYSLEDPGQGWPKLTVTYH
jgi:chitodextrinase